MKNIKDSSLKNQAVSIPNSKTPTRTLNHKNYLNTHKINHPTHPIEVLRLFLY